MKNLLRSSSRLTPLIAINAVRSAGFWAFVFALAIPCPIWAAQREGRSSSQSTESTGGDQCQLRVSKNVKETVGMGRFSLDIAHGDSLVFSSAAGNLLRIPLSKDLRQFNKNTLLMIRNEKGNWYFRYGGDMFDQETSRTGFYDVTWANGKFPATPDSFEFSTADDPTPPNLPNSSVELDMVGDSIIWWSVGQKFRCLLAQHLETTRFVGRLTDTYGFGHDGQGGDTSADVINRLQLVPVSNAYYLAVGTNDRGPPHETLVNLKKIVNLLSKKSPSSMIFVATVLPRNDEHDPRTRVLNKLIRSWISGSKNSRPLRLIETELPWRAKPNWRSLYWDSGIHPNIGGYKRLAEIVAPQLKRFLE